MNTRAMAIAILLIRAVVASVSEAAPAAVTPDAVRTQVEAGRLLFAGACANCHGSTGQGAIGPALADRGLSPELVRGTVLNGRVGTPMPPFKDDLDPKSMAQILAYVQSITSGGRLPTEVVSLESVAGAAGGLTEPSTVPVAVGTERGVAARGAALFYDPTRLTSCRTCHSYAGKGGPVGPDLSGVHESPLDVLQALTHPHRPAPAFPVIALELRDGTHLTGISSEESGDAIRVFDLESLPPVRRNIRKSDIKARTAIAASGAYDHAQLGYKRQELLDLSAFLGR